MFDEPEDDYWDVAQVCLNGHLVTSTAATAPQYQEKFCTKCGAETLMKCPRCKGDVRGHLHQANVIGPGPEHPNAYCHECGAAYPWTERALAAAKEAIEADLGLQEADKRALNESLEDLVRETPRTPVAISRFRKLRLAAPGEIWEILRGLLVNVVSQGIGDKLWKP